jgi:large subunit ribosomal protein L22
MSTTGTAARLRYVRTSPSKVRQVLRLIQGQDIETARATLALCEKGIADDLAKLLDSAVANAEHNDSVPADDLFVSRAFADEGPTGKRWRPRARGRGTRIRKRTSHVTIVVARFDEDELERRRQQAAANPTRGRPTRRTRRPRRERAAAVEAHEHEHDHDHDHDHDHEHDHEHDHDEDVEVVDAPDPVLADTDESGESADAASDTDGTEENA